MDNVTTILDVIAYALDGEIAWFGTAGKKAKDSLRQIVEFGSEYFIEHPSELYYPVCYTTDESLADYIEHLQIYIAVLCNNANKAKVENAKKLLPDHVRLTCKALRKVGIEAGWTGKGPDPIIISNQFDLETSTFYRDTRKLRPDFSIKYIDKLLSHNVSQECCVLFVKLIDKLCQTGLDPYYTNIYFEKLGKYFDIEDLNKFTKEQLEWALANLKTDCLS